MKARPQIAVGTPAKKLIDQLWDQYELLHSNLAISPRPNLSKCPQKPTRQKNS